MLKIKAKFEVDVENLRAFLNFTNHHHFLTQRFYFEDFK